MHLAMHLLRMEEMASYTNLETALPGVSAPGLQAEGQAGTGAPAIRSRIAAIWASHEAGHSE
jgi:hypothetical protein